MEFRKAKESDAVRIIDIIRQAQDYLKNCGINQWQNNYPNMDTILDDMQNNRSYVLEKDGMLVGTAAIAFDGERTYDTVYDGGWLCNCHYAVIHRIAVDSGYKGSGIATEMIKYFEGMCLSREVHSIRVDTHRENASMRRMLDKNGFGYCGIIYLADKSERIAYEKLI
jgi:ribosomal protein S18 acetylase RimI-like enzyme